MDFHFSWQDSNLICSPVPWFEECDSFFLSLPGVSAVTFEAEFDRIILETDFYTELEKTKFQKMLISSLLLVVLALGACDDGISVGV